ncbi:MAG: HAD-IB family phosphatase [Halobacteriaceae archaeon]
MTVVAFDFRGTLSDSEMKTLLGEQCGAAEEMGEIHDRARNDEITHAQSFRRRCALLEGLSHERVQAAFDRVELRPGAADLITDLRDAGVSVAVITSGFERGVVTALEHAGVAVDAAVANRLPVTDGELSGEVEGPLVEGTKDDALEVLTTAIGDGPEDAVAVGDGGNDRPMFDVAGLAIGFDPRPDVEPACDVVVTTMADLADVLERESIL